MGSAFLAVREKARFRVQRDVKKLWIEIDARTLMTEFWNNESTYRVALRAARERDWYIS